ncbi:MAG: hypothetical protein KIT31_18955 [Deltaproteobacteria bacterium]|nr:hypothetical protein [Deltaproteobacteria bacterium]
MTAITTSMVAIFLLLAVPFATLRFAADKVECCCPDPDRCKCHDHAKAKHDKPIVKACHNDPPKAATATPMPPFAAVHQLAVAMIPPPRAAVPIVDDLARPHPPPPPRRPDAPS